MAKKYIGENSLRQLWTNIENKIKSEVATAASDDSQENLTNLLDISYSQDTRSEYHWDRANNKYVSDYVPYINTNAYLNSTAIPSEYISYFEDNYGDVYPPQILLRNNFTGAPIDENIAFLCQPTGVNTFEGDLFLEQGIGLYVNTSTEYGHWAKVLTGNDISYDSEDENYYFLNGGGPRVKIMTGNDLDISSIAESLQYNEYFPSAVENNLPSWVSDLSNVPGIIDLLDSSISTILSNIEELYSICSEISSNNNLESSIGLLESNLSTVESNLSNAQSDITNIYNILSRNGLS